LVLLLEPFAPGRAAVDVLLDRLNAISDGLKSKITNPTFGSVVQRSEAGTLAPASAAIPIPAPIARFAPMPTAAPTPMLIAALLVL
jgi:hypothetical protein